ncbi:hypothetical protein OG455_18810 [Kitasatospora sp. NBC_01287]|uniref:hypothetical protein n=1 Tax=Kitasatospora sp. NBC_01287 TaxID=2903573 RepID=UPI0022595CD0|nr:hypothetical protein [Kitasatospora sp. NBC_01287]MCX4747544.1 hypothetical protein [Kitasatospora sp. NBC_01287]
MASVHKEIRQPDRPAPAKGGHLAVITGHEDGTLTFCNPSGRTTQTPDAELPVETFAQFYAERGAPRI